MWVLRGLHVGDVAGMELPHPTVSVVVVHHYSWAVYSYYCSQQLVTFKLQLISHVEFSSFASQQI